MPFAPLASARARHCIGALAAGGVLALVLVGCMGAPSPAPSPEPTETAAVPIFASDEEALAAAVDAYERYRAISAEISEAGGHDSNRIDPVVSPEYAAT